ncbi:hypothetical protein BGW38_000462 [Lunasporangiospora selenospora]|uniref:Uncharacterized protein n=1 Tax=Lunasporangiospora selenospora TaxID=979761 RepID=A0A9P6FVM1_9FUNG|nr:hypothetical protein BGW38_000462 [Lunasporangiospora selenospora]
MATTHQSMHGTSFGPFAGSPSILEINLRRLMEKCESRAEDAERNLHGSDRTKYLMNIKALREMLVDLREEATQRGRTDNSTLEEYTQRIEMLASESGDVTMAFSPNKRNLIQTRAPLPTLESLDEDNAEQVTSSWRESSTFGDRRQDRSQDLGEPQNRQQGQQYSKEDNAALLGLRDRRTGKDQNSRTTDTREIARDQSRVEHALQNDRAQREEMEASLSRLVKQLRHNATSIHNVLKEEEATGVLRDADQLLDTNISRLGKERVRLELYSKQSRKTKWMIWGIVLGVSIIFVLMFFVIRIL